MNLKMITIIPIFMIEANMYCISSNVVAGATTGNRAGKILDISNILKSFQ